MYQQKQKKMKTQIAKMKNVKVSDIKNLDLQALTFELGASRFYFELTKSGKAIKKNSIKFLSTISNYQNCSC